jgi:hypothetical protein
MKLLSGVVSLLNFEQKPNPVLLLNRQPSGRYELLEKIVLFNSGCFYVQNNRQPCIEMTVVCLSATVFGDNFLS